MELGIHKHASKKLQKAPAKIQQKFIEFVEDFLQKGSGFPRFPITKMKGKYSLYKEAKIDKDYRVVFREEKSILYIRYAGTHNELGTG